MAGLESRGGGAGSLLTPLPLGTSCSQRNFLVKHLLHSPHVTALPPLMISYMGSFSHPALWCSQVLEETDASPGCHTPVHPTDGSLTHPEVTFDFSYASSSNIKQVRLLIFYLPQPCLLYFSEALYPDGCL